MSTKIERLLYYERQYLRSFDFVAEQNYHLEMRRRLNLALHLWGIVVGLDVQKVEPPVPGVPDQFFISPGMAIDAYGREIFLFAPYILSEEDVLNNHINAAGQYSLWIAYRRESATPPEAGYRVCDITDQYTRWRESYQIIISNDANPGQEPKVTEPLADDPEQSPWRVRLGSVSIDGALNIVDAWSKDRVYIGSRTQRIVAPVASLAPTARDANLAIGVEADLTAEKNLLVGTHFDIDTTKVKPPPPAAPPFPGTEGNVKVANNLFVQGNLYAKSGDEWIELQQYVLKLIPETQIGSKTIIPIASTTVGAVLAEGNETISITSNLTSIQSAKMIASISSIDWLGRTNFNTWNGSIDGTEPTRLEVTVESVQITNNQVDFSVKWRISPQAPTPLNKLNVTSLTISYVAILTP